MKGKKVVQKKFSLGANERDEVSCSQLEKYPRCKTSCWKRQKAKRKKHQKSEERCKKVDIKVEIGKLFLVVLPNGIYDMYVSSQKWLI